MKTPDPIQTRAWSASDFAWMLVSRRSYALAILLALIVSAVSVRNPRFLSLLNIQDLFANCSQTAIIGCGVMLVIIAGEIDISVGSSLGLLTALLGTMVSAGNSTIPGLGWPVWAGILLTLALGTVIGLVNGLLVTLVRVPSIIVTLAMLMILRSVTKMIMHRGNLDSPDGLYTVWGVGKFLGIPVPIVVMLGVVAGTWLMVRYTPIGRRIYAVGSNPHAAALAGLSVSRLKIFAFALTGFLVGVATVVTQLSKFDNGIGEGRELLVITCVVVGGISISGGTGTVIGMFLAVLLLESQKSFLIFLDLGQGLSKWDKAIQGGLILGAVLIDHAGNRRKARAGKGGYPWIS